MPTDARVGVVASGAATAEAPEGDGLLVRNSDRRKSRCRTYRRFRNGGAGNASQLLTARSLRESASRLLLSNHFTQAAGGLNKGTRGQLKGDVPVGGTVEEPPTDATPTLASVGISKKQSARAIKLRAEGRLGEMIAEQKAGGRSREGDARTACWPCQDGSANDRRTDACIGRYFPQAISAGAEAREDSEGGF
jgi:hypothetical protein